VLTSLAILVLIIVACGPRSMTHTLAISFDVMLQGLVWMNRYRSP